MRRCLVLAEVWPLLARSGSLNYTSHMKFEWDQLKSEACFLERGFDFVFAAHAFFDPNRLLREDTRHSYGEVRYQLVGSIDGRLFVVIYTLRHDVMRIISARKANQREEKQYENRTHDD